MTEDISFWQFVITLLLYTISCFAGGMGIEADFGLIAKLRKKLHKKKVGDAK